MTDGYRGVEERDTAANLFRKELLQLVEVAFVEAGGFWVFHALFPVSHTEDLVGHLRENTTEIKLSEPRLGMEFTSM